MINNRLLSEYEHLIAQHQQENNKECSPKYSLAIDGYPSYSVSS
jgi:hypothetical protein